MNVKTLVWKEKDSFFNRCFERFGSMNKNDYEVALFHLLLTNEYPSESDYSLSSLLQIPESKVKRLRYEESLVYPKQQMLSKEYYKEELAKLLVNRKYRVHNERIQFSISEKHFRLYINDVLMKDGRFADTSFNANIVSLTPVDLLFLMEHTDVKSKNNIKKIREDIESGKKELEKDVAEAFQELSDEALKEIFRKFMSESLIEKLGLFSESLVKNINNRITKNK